MNGYGPRRITGAAVEQGKITVIQSVFINDQWQIEKGFTLDGSSTDSLEDKARCLNDRLILEKIQTDTLILTFPQHKAIAKTCVLPSTKAAEIRSMLLLQAAQTWPLGMDEIVVDYQLLETLPKGHSRVAMILVRQADLREALAVFNAAGRYPARVVLDSFAVLPLIRGGDLKEETCLVVELRGECVTLGIFNGLLLCVARSILLPPGLTLNDPTNWMRVMRDEIQRTLLSASVPVPKEPFQMMLAGDEPSLGEAQPLMALIWPGPVTPVRPSDRVTFQEGTVKPHSSCWPALAASLMCSGHERTMNLLSDAEQRRGTRDIRRRAGLATLAMSLFLFTVGGATLLRQFHAKKMARNTLQCQCAELNAQTQDLQRMNRMIELVQGRMSQDGSFLNLVAELNRRLPAHVSVRSLDYEAGQALSLQGNCFSLSEAVHLVEELQRSPLFSSVEMRSSTIQHLGSRDVVDFSLVCRLPLAKEKNRRPHADA